MASKKTVKRDSRGRFVKWNTDGWYNQVTGLGVIGRDRNESAIFLPGADLMRSELSALYYYNSLAKKIVDAPIEDAFRAGYYIKDAEGEVLDVPEELKAQIDTGVKELIRWHRLYGGAGLFLDAPGTGAPASPLNPESIKKLNTPFAVWDKFYLSPASYYRTLDAKYGYPETYTLGQTQLGAPTGPTVHETRLLKMRGVPVDRQELIRLNFWGHSVLQAVYSDLKLFGQAEAALADLLTDASIGVYKMHGLVNAVASGNAATMQERMALVDMAKSTKKPIVLDADPDLGEEYERKNTTFSGAGDVWDRFERKVSVATGIPVTILFGRSAAGMNATGEGDEKQWQKIVAAFEVAEVKPALMALYGYMLPGFSEEYEICFHPLSEMSDQEAALLRKTQADVDKIYVDMGLPPENVILSRFGRGEYSVETEIDVDAWEAANEAVDLEEELAPEPEPPPGGPGGSPPPKGKAPGYTEDADIPIYWEEDARPRKTPQDKERDDVAKLFDKALKGTKKAVDPISNAQAQAKQASENARHSDEYAQIGVKAKSTESELDADVAAGEHRKAADANLRAASSILKEHGNDIGKELSQQAYNEQTSDAHLRAAAFHGQLAKLGGPQGKVHSELEQAHALLASSGAGVSDVELTKADQLVQAHSSGDTSKGREALKQIDSHLKVANAHNQVQKAYNKAAEGGGISQHDALENLHRATVEHFRVGGEKAFPSAYTEIAEGIKYGHLAPKGGTEESRNKVAAAQKAHSASLAATHSGIAGVGEWDEGKHPRDENGKFT